MNNVESKKSLKELFIWHRMMRRFSGFFNNSNCSAEENERKHVLLYLGIVHCVFFSVSRRVPRGYESVIDLNQ